MKALLSTAAIAGLILAGCASEEKRPPVDTSLKGEPSIECRAGAECSQMWARARQWLTDNTGLQVVNVNPDRVETVRPGTTRRYMLDYAIERLNKEADTQQIAIRAECALVSGCLRNADEQIADFMQTLKSLRTQLREGVVEPDWAEADEESRPAPTPTPDAPSPVVERYTNEYADVVNTNYFDAIDAIAEQRNCSPQSRISLVLSTRSTRTYELDCVTVPVVTIECDSQRCRVLRQP